MQVEVEKLAGLQCKLKVTLPAEQLEKAYQSRIQKIAADAKMDGFRPGKVPLQLIESRFGASVREEVASEMMQSSFHAAVLEQKLQIAGQPSIDKHVIEKGKPLEFEAVFETYPEINLADFSQVSIERPVAEIGEQEVTEMIDKIRRQQADWAEVERACQDGDRVKIDFDGTLDKKAFDGGAAKDMALELGSKQMIPGFEDGIVGMKTGDVKDVDVTFPDDYQAKDLAGKKAVFKITLNTVEEPTLPELDDDFIKKVGADSLEKLKEDVRKGLTSELKRGLQDRAKKNVMDQLVKLNPLEIPESLVETETKHLQDMTRSQMAAQRGMQTLPDVELPTEPYIEQARKRVTIGLLVGEVIKVNSIRVDGDQVNARIRDIAAAYPEPEKVFEWYKQNKQMLAEIEAAVVEDQAVEVLLESATVTDKPVSCKEILDNPQGD